MLHRHSKIEQSMVGHQPFIIQIDALQLHLYLEDRGDQAEMRGEADG